MRCNLLLQAVAEVHDTGDVLLTASHVEDAGFEDDRVAEFTAEILCGLNGLVVESCVTASPTFTPSFVSGEPGVSFVMLSVPSLNAVSTPTSAVSKNRMPNGFSVTPALSTRFVLSLPKPVRGTSIFPQRKVPRAVCLTRSL